MENNGNKKDGQKAENKPKNKEIKTKGWYYKLELSKKTALWGWIFLMPWLLGFLMFLLRPLIQSFRYAFSDVKIISTGGIEVNPVGLSNFEWALTTDTTFVQLLTDMVWQTILTVLIVVVFSLIISVVLNGKYRGRSIARAIFFIPIIMGTQIASTTINHNDALSMELSGGEEAMAFGMGFLSNILNSTGFSPAMTGYVLGAVSNIFTILAMTGVPILIFLAGLQAIPSSMYEVAKIEGASSYETFWKVTFPMISPMIFLCTIYSTVDAFQRHEITTRMYDVFKLAQYGLSAAMTILYLIVCLVVLGVIALMFKRRVFYYD